MRVLYLVPQPKRTGQLSAYTFLDEEIHGLAAGNVLLEAMASARPVVFMESPEYIHDGATGFVVPVADVKALARIRLLLDDRALADQLGQNGRGMA